MNSTVPLKRLVDPTRPITYGIVQAGDDVVDGVRYIRPIDMDGHRGVDPSALRTTSPEIAAAYTRSALRPGDVVVSIGPSFGKTLVVPRDLDGANLTQGTARVAVQAGVHARYIVWALQSQTAVDFWESSIGGATFRALNLGPLAETPIPSRTFEAQRAIADYLDRETARIDTLIVEQQCLIEILRERRAVVLATAFGPGSRTESTKVGRLLASRPSYGVLVPRYVDEADGVPFIRVGDLLNLAPERPMLTIAPEQSDEFSRTKILGGEVLLGVVGKMGQAALAPRWLAGSNVARAVAVLRCKDPDVGPLLCSWLGSEAFLYQAELATSGDSIQPTLGMKDLARFDIHLPTDPDAAADLRSRMASIDMLIGETERFVELARERRSALITGAVTGQIDVREVA